MKGIVPDEITKRDCVGKVAEIFDPLGRVAPLVSGMKLDLNELTARKLDWDDPIPEDLKKTWFSSFEKMREIGEIKYYRAIIPDDALDMDIETIDTADASENMICVAIYARFKRKRGSHSCQLVLARSKIVPKNTSIPRAELMAASLNASAGKLVKTAFGDLHKRCWKLTDSQVALHWIGCTKSALKMWVRNRVIEINRLVDASEWRYTDSRNMIADIGTRKGVKSADVGPNSEWICGKSWMRGEICDFPIKTTSEVILSNEAANEAKRESIIVDLPDSSDEGEGYIAKSKCLSCKMVPDEVGARYEYSQYLIDPNRFRFRKVIRVLGLVFLFVAKLRNKIKKGIRANHNDFIVIPDVFKYRGDRYILTTGKDPSKCAGGLVVHLPEAMVKAAMGYFYKKASDEIRKFLNKSKYKNITSEVNGILYYTGRILPSQDIEGKASLGDTSLDLCKTTFCVPVVDSRSPVAYAIISEIHWHHPDVMHGGIESVLRQAQRVAFIIRGRQLVKTIRGKCTKCRILEKQAVKVAMGPVQNVNMCVAPAFYSSQVDICGPFNSYSIANKRAVSKIWFVVFCCCTTGAVDCRLMENYSTEAFVLAFIRFSCRFGYPKLLLPDEGSQLVRGCKDMVISFANIQHQLSVEYGVEFKICPVGAHYMHGRVERKIHQIKKSINKTINNERLSVIQWETLCQQIANSINNLPIGVEK